MKKFPVLAQHVIRHTLRKMQVEQTETQRDKTPVQTFQQRSRSIIELREQEQTPVCKPNSALQRTTKSFTELKLFNYAHRNTLKTSVLQQVTEQQIVKGRVRAFNSGLKLSIVSAKDHNRYKAKNFSSQKFNRKNSVISTKAAPKLTIPLIQIEEVDMIVSD